MLFLRVVKLLMLSYIRDVAVAVVAVMAEIHFIPSVVSGASAEVAVLSVLMPVVHVKVHPLLTILAYAIFGSGLPNKRGIDFVYPARKVLVDQRQAHVVQSLIFFTYLAKRYFLSATITTDTFLFELF